MLAHDAPRHRSFDPFRSIGSPLYPVISELTFTPVVATPRDRSRRRLKMRAATAKHRPGFTSVMKADRQNDKRRIEKEEESERKRERGREIPGKVPSSRGNDAADFLRRWNTNNTIFRFVTCRVAHTRCSLKCLAKLHPRLNCAGNSTVIEEEKGILVKVRFTIRESCQVSSPLWPRREK